MGFPKLSMLAFYWVFFNLSGHPGLRKMLFGITAFVVASYLTILFDDTFFCGTPVSVQWSQEEGACSVFYAPEPFILPLFILYRSHSSTLQSFHIRRQLSNRA
jgi:hypothetical protein